MNDHQAEIAIDMDPKQHLMSWGESFRELASGIVSLVKGIAFFAVGAALLAFIGWSLVVAGPVLLPAIGIILALLLLIALIVG